MKHGTLQIKHVLVFALAGILMAGPAAAEKPSWSDNDKHSRKDKHEKRSDRHDGNSERSGDHIRLKPGKGEYFSEQRRTAAHEYYREHFRSGHCPPGLAKKHNGCRPPGHAKKWNIGHRLPGDVIFHDVSPQLIIKIGQPPSGHRYVRVAMDILLIAIGTGMVIDAIEDLGDM